MLGIDAILVEKTIIQCRVEMNESAGNRAGAHANLHRRFARLCEIRICVGVTASSAKQCNKERGEKPYAQTIADQFHIETPNGTLTLVTIYEVSMKSVNENIDKASFAGIE